MFQRLIPLLVLEVGLIYVKTVPIHTKKTTSSPNWSMHENPLALLALVRVHHHHPLLEVVVQAVVGLVVLGSNFLPLDRLKDFLICLKSNIS